MRNRRGTSGTRRVRAGAFGVSGIAPDLSPDRGCARRGERAVRDGLGAPGSRRGRTGAGGWHAGGRGGSNGCEGGERTRRVVPGGRSPAGRRGTTVRRRRPRRRGRCPRPCRGGRRPDRRRGAAAAGGGAACAYFPIAP